VRARDRKDPREALAARLIGKGWGVRRLEIRKVSLEALFTDVVLRRAEAIAPEPAAAPAA
jgi:hypothetical protein